MRIHWNKIFLIASIAFLSITGCYSEKITVELVDIKTPQLANEIKSEDSTFEYELSYLFTLNESKSMLAIGYGLDEQELVPDPMIPGSHSHLLNYTLSYQAATEHEEGYFQATLTNVSEEELLLDVNDKEFWASIEIINEPKESIDAYDEDYLNLILTSSYINFSYVKIPPNKSINWIVPLSTLRTFRSLNQEQVSFAMIESHQVVSRMRYIAVTQDSVSHVVSNAKQTSKPITIPKRN